MFRGFDSSVNNHHIYLDGNDDPILLPCIFALYTETCGVKVDHKKQLKPNSLLYEHRIEEKDIGKDTAYKICNYLGRFLQWVDEYSSSEMVNLNTHTALPSVIINEFLNEYLIDECNASESVAKEAKNSLTAYYNWLSFYFKNKSKVIGIKPRFRPVARNNSKGASAVKYLLPATRELFYASAKTLLHEIILRVGGELGCRARENRGFLLNDFISNRKSYSGLKTLFSEMEKYPDKEEFEYHLGSVYTKYGRSRTLYIPRNLLAKMKKYYDENRPNSSSNHLFVSDSNNNRGEPLGNSYACRVFFEVKSIVLKKIDDHPSIYSHYQNVEVDASYHFLRHSFGTDIFFNLCEGQNKSVESITTASSVYIETARRMGHKVDAKGASDVTKTYIHSCGHRERLLKDAISE